MKRMGLLVMATLLCSGGAWAENFEIPESVTMSSEHFEGYTPKKGDVIFNHTSHMDIPCADCHHMLSETFTIEGCMAEGCHDNIATRTESTSVYKAFHTGADTTKSCVGCHRKVKKNDQGEPPLVCNDCHS